MNNSTGCFGEDSRNWPNRGVSVRPFGTIVAQFQHLSREFHRRCEAQALPSHEEKENQNSTPTRTNLTTQSSCKGDVPTVTEGGILGHKGIDIIDGREHFELRSLVRGEFPHCMKLTWKI